jgi:adenylate cyclase
MNWLRTWLQPWWRGVALAISLWFLISLGVFETSERAALNLFFEFRGPIPPKTPVVIVSIGEESFDELNLQWPWPRAVHAKFLDIVTQGKPAAIGFDIVFPEPSSRGPADDKALGAAVERARNVVLAAALTRAKTSSYTKESLNPPIEAIRGQRAAVGFANFDPDDDAFVRAASLVLPFQDRQIESLDLHLYRLAVQAGIPARPLPSSRKSFLINYRGGPQTFPTIPYYQVLNGEVSPEEFTGKIVLVGATSPILHDLFPTPFSTTGLMPGVEIHANVLDTLFQGIPINRTPRSLIFLCVLATTVAAIRLTHRLRPLPSLAVVFGVSAAYIVGSFAAFAWGHLWLDVTVIPSALLVGHAATTIEDFIREQREKRRLSRFFSPAVVSEVVRYKSDLQLGSSRRLMTVLFSDIRGFTSMSEKMTPEEVAGFLREYLTVMTEAVFKEGGTVDKYIGDAIMALWNAPFEQPDHAARAVRTALAFQERLEPLAVRFREKYGSDLRCGVGVNTGDAVVGTIGSEQRLEYTAIGDTINLGSRLESITKDFKVPIVISESTQSYLGPEFLTRYLGEVKVKGKEIPVKIYSVEPASSRQDARVAVNGTVVIREDDISLSAVLRDLSRSGLSVRHLPKDYIAGATVTLEATLPATDHTLTLKATVMWSREGKTGFRFLDLTSEQLQAIESALASSPTASRIGV